MPKKLQRFFSPPAHTQEVDTWRAHLLHQILWSTILVALPISLTGFFLLGRSFFPWVFLGFSLSGITLVIRMVLSPRKPTLAALLFSITLLLHAILGVFYSGSIRAPLLVMFLLPILISTLLINLPTGQLMTLITVIILYLLLPAEQSRDLLAGINSSTVNNVVDLGVYSVIAMILSYLIGLYTNNLREALLIARREVKMRQKTEQQLERRLAFEKSISKISSRFVGEVADFEAAVQISLQEMANLSQADRINLFYLNDNPKTASLAYQWCRPGIPSHKTLISNQPLRNISWWGSELKRKAIIQIPDVTQMPKEASLEKSLLEKMKIKSLLAFPILTNGRMNGFIGFDKVKEASPWHKEDITMLRLVTEIINTAVIQKNTEKALITSEVSFRSLVEQSPFGTAIFDPSGQVRTANQAMANLWKMPPDGFSHLLANFNIFEDPVLKQHGLIPLIRKAFKGEPVNVPIIEYDSDRHPVDAKTKEKLWIEGHLYPVKDATGAIREVVLIQEDVSARMQTEANLKLSEERFRHVFEDGPIGIHLIDTHLRLFRVNDALCQMLGYQEEELIKRPLADIIYPEDAKEGVDLALKMKAGEIAGYQLERRYIRKNGELIWANIKASIIRNEDGEPLIGVGIVENITQRKEVENQFAPILG